MKYNDTFDAEKQISAEERIAFLLSDVGDDDDEKIFSEEDCQQLSRNILLEVLNIFRLDLFDGHQTTKMKFGKLEPNEKHIFINSDDKRLYVKINVRDAAHNNALCLSTMAVEYIDPNKQVDVLPYKLIP